MPRLPRVTTTQMMRALRRDGWEVTNIVGSHYQFVHPTKAGKVTVAMHRGDLDVRTTSKILGQAGLSADDLRRLL